jgi:hypothetical protein
MIQGYIENYDEKGTRYYPTISCTLDYKIDDILAKQRPKWVVIFQRKEKANGTHEQSSGRPTSVSGDVHGAREGGGPRASHNTEYTEAEPRLFPARRASKVYEGGRPIEYDNLLKERNFESTSIAKGAAFTSTQSYPARDLTFRKHLKNMMVGDRVPKVFFWILTTIVGGMTGQPSPATQDLMKEDLANFGERRGSPMEVLGSDQPVTAVTPIPAPWNY